MTRQSFEDGNKNNSIFLNLLESRFPVRDFQEINYPSCGGASAAGGFPSVGDWPWASPPAQFIGRARCPSHKKKLNIFLFGSP
jgi:hypothetical protein